MLLATGAACLAGIGVSVLMGIMIGAAAAILAAWRARLLARRAAGFAVRLAARLAAFRDGFFAAIILLRGFFAGDLRFVRPFAWRVLAIAFAPLPVDPEFPRKVVGNG